MDLNMLMREADVADEIMRHIQECDRMYTEIHGCANETPECNVCKKLLSMGFQLTSNNLPEICIIHCDRWRIADEDEDNNATLALSPVRYIKDSGSWKGFAAEVMAYERLSARG
ncbi:MAG: hypothetical protein GF416_01905 [Candidatus Altiarchaeales archaeon]|nr:hypothetical protein [Candidatus Altiarchaeales archaeon]MBD3415871.1 hypothetical protein [Candidatus Altiarchaeales archaeon]